MQAEPLDMGVDDLDLIVTDCETKDIFRDNLGYSYTYATEKLLIDIGKLSSICPTSTETKGNVPLLFM